jgi:F420-0:gamma-glutamyl ligase-like protein
MLALMKDKWLLGLAGGFIVALLCNAVEIKTLTGLPAHPLLLHMPVIFVPTLASAAIVFAFKPSWRKRYDIAYGIGAVVALAGTSLAAAAGGAYEEMKEQMGSPDMAAIKHHGELGETLRNVMVVFALAILIQVAIDRGAFTFLKGRFDDPTTVLPVILSVGIVGLALLAGYLTYAAGHAGAKLVFGDQGRQGAPRGYPPPGGLGGYQSTR